MLEKLFEPKNLPLYCVVAILTCSCWTSSAVEIPDSILDKQEHPFLIVKKEQFQGLRQKSRLDPWKSIKTDAIAQSKKGLVWGNSNSKNAYSLQDYVGAVALAYILDIDKAALHANRVRDAILNYYARLEPNETSNWGGVVPNMGSFFVAILSLDIVYNALSPKDIAKCEEVISRQIAKINRKGPWADVRLGTHGTWDIYQGIRTEPDDDYYESIMAQITEDGVSPATIHYAWERVGGGDCRISKSGYMDVLEFTGIDQRYYNNERLQKFQRWLFGSSVNTSKEMAIIGDVLPTQSLHNDMLHRRVINFDEKAATYAAWFHEGFKAKGNILTYIIPKDELPPPQTPESQIYSDGGAFFREKPDDPNGLHAVIYNIKGQDEWHTHNEVNGLALSGYGNRLLVNGGQLGAPVRDASLNNTLTINGENHDARIGGGITEGLTFPKLDYASGFSGPAISSGEHRRSLILVHALGGATAYCVLFDEVSSDIGSQIKNYWHPANETDLTTITQSEEYGALIDHYPSVEGAQLSFFFATTPLQVVVDKVDSAVPDRYPSYPKHSRLKATYPTDPAGNANLVTILFPFDKNHEKASFTRISGTNYSGGSIHQLGSIIDVALASAGDQLINHHNVSFQAKAIVYREANNSNIFYFARKATHFLHKKSGFDSDKPISIYFWENEGAIISSGSKVTLRGRALSLHFDPPATILNTDNDFIEVAVPAGVVHFF